MDHKGKVLRYVKPAGVNLGALPLQCKTRSLIQALNTYLLSETMRATGSHIPSILDSQRTEPITNIFTSTSPWPFSMSMFFTSSSSSPCPASSSLTRAHEENLWHNLVESCSKSTSTLTFLDVPPDFQYQNEILVVNKCSSYNSSSVAEQVFFFLFLNWKEQLKNQPVYQRQ